MKIKFKKQKFQTDAVNAVVNCFVGQTIGSSTYKMKQYSQDVKQMSLAEISAGYSNAPIKIDEYQVLENIKKVQKEGGLKQSPSLDGKYNLTIEMETGTGKTYVYIKTMLELNKQYGWSKFIVVVPSVAIREGVYKSFEMTAEHFMEEYNKKIRYFIYDSNKLNQIEAFATSSAVNVMIINSQAFSSFKEGANNKAANIMYQDRDEFGSNRPIDILAETNPILIIDEPQSVEGKATSEALKKFNALFTLRYSATHKKEYNKIFRLDAKDAYDKKLVKKIEVKGIKDSSTGTNGYVYLEQIIISEKHNPKAKIHFEKMQGNNIAVKVKNFDEGDSLFDASEEMQQYKHYIISEIHANANGLGGYVKFTNGLIIFVGEVVGKANEDYIRRIQIRETIKSHLKKEQQLFRRGIKVLSLFFIDEVAKYRIYDDNNEKQKGIYAKMFEEEYNALISEESRLLSINPSYRQYLESISTESTHDGYFSIDKKGRAIDTNGSSESDTSTYDLIMKNKEELLSFENNIRFIFSHSALREGWDNPNVFQICALKSAGDSKQRKHQEVGRGLRLAVNKYGDRQDGEVLSDVHSINVLTVIANEEYKTYAKDLQEAIAETLSDRPSKVNIDLFKDVTLHNFDKTDSLYIDANFANRIQLSLAMQGYITLDGELTEKYHADYATGNIQFLEEVKPFKEEFLKLIQDTYEVNNTKYVSNADSTVVASINKDNFEKEEFKNLWELISQKTYYQVNFNSKELIDLAVRKINSELRVAKAHIVIEEGTLKEVKTLDQLKNQDGFGNKKGRMEVLDANVNSSIKYDIIGQLVHDTKLTRKTIVKILTGIIEDKFDLFKNNPEEFLKKVADFINECKAMTVIGSVEYDKLNTSYGYEVFTEAQLKGELDVDMIPSSRSIMDFIKVDSLVEKQFVHEIEGKEEIKVYAKLPRAFYIKTPMGNYAPDWALVIDNSITKNIYFVAETKGALSELELRTVEANKIECAKRHFKAISNGQVKFDVLKNATYKDLLEILQS
ncbi:MAG: DEAD/DEAH box helicase family protein [Spirochaetales bacterium]